MGGFPGMSLKAMDPVRYSSLHHPGDAYASPSTPRSAGALRSAGTVFGTLRPETFVAVGESQSASCVDIDRRRQRRRTLAKVHDRFLVIRLFGPAAPVLDGTSALDVGRNAGSFVRELRVPVMTVITDRPRRRRTHGLLPGQAADGDLLRAWDIPGTAHADNYTIKVGFIDSGSAPLADLRPGTNRPPP